MSLVRFFLALAMLVVAPVFTLTGCIPQGGDVRTIQRPVPAATPALTPIQADVPQVTGSPSAPLTQGCNETSEPAIPELRACCKERNWGKACDGGCWAAGVGEKLRKMCSDSKAPSGDCANSPEKSKKTEWCSFHYNRRYCGISDSEWIATCKTAAAATAAEPASKPSDCGQSPEKSKTREWCDFHYNRRYCGVSDADWVQTCTPAPTPKPTSTGANPPAATPKASPAGTPAKSTGVCKTTQNRGFPFPPCPKRTTAKLCEEGQEGNENGRFCVWSEN